MNRRRFLALSTAAGAGVLGADALVAEPNALDVTRHVVRGLGATLGSPLGSAGDGRRAISLVQLSDLHLHSIGTHEERIAEATNRLRPDFIALTGDVADRHDKLPVLDAFLRLLDPAVAKYAIFGNWEHWGSLDMPALKRLYARRGVELLDNRSATFSARGARLALTGVDDLVGGTPNVAAAVRSAEPGVARLVLAHCPKHRDLGAFVTPDGEAPLAMLSGHTHGGQVRLGPWAPWVPPGSGRYVDGWYRGAPFDLYVSRGLGTSMLPVRFCSAPELAHFTVEL